jgi:large subunit ribosomal protein L30
MYTAYITLIKSPIDKAKRQKDTLTALGLRKINQTVQHEMTPQIQGMVRVVAHLVSVRNIES